MLLKGILFYETENTHTGTAVSSAVGLELVVWSPQLSLHWSKLKSLLCLLRCCSQLLGVSTWYARPGWRKYSSRSPFQNIANEQSTMPKWGPNGSGKWSVNNNVIEARKRRCAQWQVWPTAAEHTCGTTHFQNNSSRRSIMTRKLFRKHSETSLHRSFFWQLKRTSPSKVKNSSTAPPYIYVHKKELFSMHIKR